MKDEVFTCCICGALEAGFGNNPDGAMWLDEATKEPVIGKFGPNDRCCDLCDQKYVIPGRIYQLQKARQVIN